MHVGNRLVGLGFAALGVTGIVVCLAGIVCIWLVASRLQWVNSEVFGKFDQLIAQVERRTEQAGDAADCARRRTRNVEEIIQLTRRWTAASSRTRRWRNLTQDSSPALIHFADGQTQQWLMVRIPEPQQ